MEGVPQQYKLGLGLLALLLFGFFATSSFGSSETLEVPMETIPLNSHTLGISAKQKKEALKAHKGKKEDGHWAKVKGEDGQTYTQWQGDGDIPTGSGIVRGHAFVKGIVTATSNDGVSGYTTYRLTVEAEPGSVAVNVYTIFGDKTSALSMPPAYQIEPPFGADVGGVSPQFFKIKPEAAFDSWLTVGVAGGNNKNALSKIGVNFDSWTPTTQLYADDGAIFWMDPDAAPPFADGPVVVGQLTVKSGLGFKATVNAQGRSGHVGHDWEQQGILFKS